MGGGEGWRQGMVPLQLRPSPGGKKHLIPDDLTFITSSFFVSMIFDLLFFFFLNFLFCHTQCVVTGGGGVRAHTLTHLRIKTALTDALMNAFPVLCLSD